VPNGHGPARRHHPRPDGVTNPDGNSRDFTYGSHKLTVESWGSETTTLTYDGTTGQATNVNRGGGATTSLTPQVGPGLAASPAKNASASLAVVTDALSQPTTFTLDTQGRATKLQTPDGGTQQWTRNAAGLPTTYTDALYRVTTYTYAASSGASADDVTAIDHPDGGSDQYTYDATYHKAHTHVDPLNHTTTYGYDGGTGDLLTVKDATTTRPPTRGRTA